MIETLGTDEIFKREDAEKRRELRVEHQKNGRGAYNGDFEGIVEQDKESQEAKYVYTYIYVYF